MLLRGVLGATAAVTVALLLQLRVVDFPFLHAGGAENSSMSVAALYVFGFMSGLAVQRYFGKFERTRIKDRATGKTSEAEEPVGHPS